MPPVLEIVTLTLENKLRLLLDAHLAMETSVGMGWPQP